MSASTRQPANLTDAGRKTPLVLERRHDGRLWATSGDDSRAVRVHRCFPWSDPLRFISLRDENQDEFALVVDPAELDPASRTALEQALADAGFVMEITRILEIEDEIEIRTWKVETKQGPRSFQTRRDDWPREVPGGTLLVRDVAGDLYAVRDQEGLDRKSQDLLWALTD